MSKQDRIKRELEHEEARPDFEMARQREWERRLDEIEANYTRLVTALVDGNAGDAVRILRDPVIAANWTATPEDARRKVLARYHESRTAEGWSKRGRHVTAWVWASMEADFRAFVGHWLRNQIEREARERKNQMHLPK